MGKKYDLLVVALFAIMAFVASASAQMSFSGEVVDVIDGRTVILSASSGRIKIQLQYIDVPEPDQELHKTVEDHLRTLTVGKTISFRPRNILSDRTIGQLTLNNVDLSQQMLRDGAAWHIPSKETGQESGDFQLYASTEAAAKADKIGIWAIPGMRPAWEVRAENLEKAKREEDEAWLASFAGNKGRSINPAFKNVGALLNRYDPESMTGLLSTSYVPVDLSQDLQNVEKISLAITYYYQQFDDQKRKGSYVVAIAFLSKKAQFATNNELTVWDNGKITGVIKPKRFAAVKDDGVHETLAFPVSRQMLDRAAGNPSVFLRIGHHVIYMTGGRYLVYNLLQVTQ